MHSSLPSAPPWWPTDRRGLLLAAMADVVSERGYAATRVADILRETGVSSRSFYAHFTGFDECFFATYDAIVADVRDFLSITVPQGIAVPQGGRFDIEFAVGRVLAHFARWPSHAQVLLVEISAAGPDGIARHEQTMGRLADRVARCGLWQPAESDSLPRPELARATVGAATRIIELRLSAGLSTTLPDLLPTIVALTTRMGSRPERSTGACTER